MSLVARHGNTATFKSSLSRNGRRVIQQLLGPHGGVKNEVTPTGRRKSSEPGQQPVWFSAAHSNGNTIFFNIKFKN